jgi:site-specific DNA-methyltransferase (adenine-specific)
MSLETAQPDRITDSALRFAPNKTGATTDARIRPSLGAYDITFADAFAWLAGRAENSIHAIVTDPPYGLKEYSEEEKAKLRKGRGGIWRIPPSFDGHKRSPLPRFTVLDESDIAALRAFFEKFGTLAMRVLVPGGHVMIATNPLVSQYVYLPMIAAGFEKRGEIIRLVQTLRGGDRPKNAHNEFPDVSVMPRSGWEPWGLFRKPCEGRVQDNLRKWDTGGLRRISGKDPFLDVIRSSPARNGERKIAPHPSLKPQAFMRQLVRAALPLGRGIVLDPFMGSGSTVAAASAIGYTSIGIERDSAYFALATKAIPALARYSPKDAVLERKAVSSTKKAVRIRSGSRMRPRRRRTAPLMNFRVLRSRMANPTSKDVETAPSKL